jgi:hypothetical protein
VGGQLGCALRKYGRAGRWGKWVFFAQALFGLGAIAKGLRDGRAQDVAVEIVRVHQMGAHTLPATHAALAAGQRATHSAQLGSRR